MLVLIHENDHMSLLIITFNFSITSKFRYVTVLTFALSPHEEDSKTRAVILKRSFCGCLMSFSLEDSLHTSLDFCPRHLQTPTRGFCTRSLLLLNFVWCRNLDNEMYSVSLVVTVCHRVYRRNIRQAKYGMNWFMWNLKTEEIAVICVLSFLYFLSDSH